MRREWQRNRTRQHAVLSIAALAAASMVITLPAAAVAAEEDEHVELTVQIPTSSAGEFTWSAPSAVSLGEASVQGGALVATANLAVDVSDTRPGQQGWRINGQATEFERDPSTTFSSAYLGWLPTIETAGAGAVAGEEAPSGYDPNQPHTPSGAGLNTERTLASATSGWSPTNETDARIAAVLTLRVPVSTLAGEYESTLSLTAVLGG